MRLTQQRDTFRHLLLHAAGNPEVARASALQAGLIHESSAIVSPSAHPQVLHISSSRDQVHPQDKSACLHQAICGCRARQWHHHLKLLHYIRKYSQAVEQVLCPCDMEG